MLCSPKAAASPYVNEEVRHFKALGRAARVIAIIVAGEPGDRQNECFPPALRFKIDTAGAITDEREEPIAADVRPQGDGKEVAKLKVVAGLLGVGLDEIMRREKRARKRRNLRRLAFAGAAMLIVAAAALGWRGVHLLHSQLLDAEDVNTASEAAEVCERASSVAMADVWRIGLASDCVETLREILADLPQGMRLPAHVTSAFQENLAVLRKFEAQRKLTNDQSDALARAELVARRLAGR